MSHDTRGGWNASADAWIEAMGEAGDYGRRYVLDQPMLARIRRQPFTTALDVGCGEGRFCRMMQALGLSTVGIDPMQALIDRARHLDPSGDYRTAERSGGFGRQPRIIRCCGELPLACRHRRSGHGNDKHGGGATAWWNIADRQSHQLQHRGMPDGWAQDHQGKSRFSIDHYLQERAVWVGWRGIRIQTGTGH